MSVTTIDQDWLSPADAAAWLHIGGQPLHDGAHAANQEPPLPGNDQAHDGSKLLVN